MSKTYFISDTHFMHRNMTERFTTPDSNKCRPFNTMEECDEYMIQEWNNIVKDVDRVYHLGDISIPKKGLSILSKLNGRKALIGGNHEPWKLKDLQQYFDYIYGCKMLPKMGIVMTHIPVHEMQLYGIWKHNVHGHTHNRRVTKPNSSDFDLRYFNCSVEWINFKPIEIEELKVRLNNSQDKELEIYRDIHGVDYG